MTSVAGSADPEFDAAAVQPWLHQAEMRPFELIALAAPICERVPFAIVVHAVLPEAVANAR